jgi:hypothetical protein
MNREDIRRELHDILNAHDAALNAIRLATTSMADAHNSMGLARRMHDDAIVSAIEANRAAIRLLNRLEEERT